jgi:hypothetical protein
MMKPGAGRKSFLDQGRAPYGLASNRAVPPCRSATTRWTKVTPTRIEIKTTSGSLQGFYRKPQVDYALIYETRLKLIRGNFARAPKSPSCAHSSSRFAFAATTPAPISKPQRRR